MASEYQIIDGHDNVGTLATVTPQPRSTGIQYPVTIYAPAAAYVDGKPYTIWIYDSLTRAQFNTLRTQFGLTDTTVFNDVTVNTLGNDDAFATYNARIEHVTKPRDPFYWKNVEFKVYNLEATS